MPTSAHVERAPSCCAVLFKAYCNSTLAAPLRISFPCSVFTRLLRDLRRVLGCCSSRSASYSFSSLFSFPAQQTVLFGACELNSQSNLMARLNTMSAAAAVCFLAFVCVQVVAQPTYAPEIAPSAAPMMPPADYSPVESPTYAPELSPVLTPTEAPALAPMAPPPVAAGPGLAVVAGSSASSIVPSAAFAVLSIAAFFLH